jgi:hypothetical protein
MQKQKSQIPSHILYVFCCSSMIKYYNQLNNHLSVELIPWHTCNIHTINGYINRNINPILIYCLCFAASQSLRIQNNKLRNKVILRLSGNSTIRILKDIAKFGFGSYSIICGPNYTISGDGGYLKFSISCIKNVEFISIWGKRSRSNFPPIVDMDWIFSHII